MQELLRMNNKSRFIFIGFMLLFMLLSLIFVSRQAHAYYTVTTVTDLEFESTNDEEPTLWTISVTSNAEIPEGTTLIFQVSYFDYYDYDEHYLEFDDIVYVNGESAGVPYKYEYLNYVEFYIDSPVTIAPDETFTISSTVVNPIAGTYDLGAVVVVLEGDYEYYEMYNVTFGTPTLVVDDQSIQPGASFTIDMLVGNTLNEKLTGLEFTLESSAKALVLDEIPDDSFIQANVIDENTFRFLIGNSDQVDISTETISLPFTLLEDFYHGFETTVTLTDIVFSNDTGKAFYAPDQSFKVTAIDEAAPTITTTTTDLNKFQTNLSFFIEGTGSEYITANLVKGSYNVDYFQGMEYEFSCRHYRPNDGDLNICDFHVPIKHNGIYTIYARDEAGNENVYTFTISHLYLQGDADDDDDVDVVDWQMLANIILRIDTVDERQEIALDMNDDGALNVADWVLLLQYLVN